MKRKLLEQESSRKKPCRGLDFSEETVVKTEEEPALETETKIQTITGKKLNVDVAVYQAVLNILTKNLILPLTVESLVKFHVLSTVKEEYEVVHTMVCDILKYFASNKYITLWANDKNKKEIGLRPEEINKNTTLISINIAELMSLVHKSHELIPNETQIAHILRETKYEVPDEKMEITQRINSLLGCESIVDRNLTKYGSQVTSLLHQTTFSETSLLKTFRSKGGPVVREFCAHGTKKSCREQNQKVHACIKIHYIRVIKNHTIPALGDCSYLDGCRHMSTCRYVHYKIDDSIDSWEERDSRERSIKSSANSNFQYKYKAQYINCDVRSFPFHILHKYSVIMADPPWDIHMELPYGTLKDSELLNLPVGTLSDDGIMLLWITGRVVELARKCLKKWGYECVQELIWVKTNQLQRLIRTGRTGHWINHSKEHCLIGVKGNPKLNKKIDCDVLVSEVRETSRKPDEVYELCERLSPGTPKLELFGREHNMRDGWMTLGNQLPRTRILDPKILEQFQREFPNANIETS